MPFHLHIPLPGPFSYSTRLGERRRRGGASSGSALYWLLIGWRLLPTWLIPKWTALGSVWLCVYGYGLATGNTRPPRIVNGRITR